MSGGYPKRGTPEYDTWTLTPEYKKRCQTAFKTVARENYMNLGFPKKGTQRYEEWISTPGYRTHCLSSSGRTCGNKNPMYKTPPWNKGRTGVYTEETRTKMSTRSIEFHIGGFWYGNVKYNDPSKYCELWCPDLWHRIDGAQNYQSILSGKTKFENGGRNLSRHHVYWQPKACCEWDEDVQGYYVWIDIGTPNHPNVIKYYINGDPNKFVLLTISEHMMIRRDKLKWIGIFEDLIKTKLGGVCYLPKEIKI